MQRRPEDRPPAQNEKISLKSLLKMFLKFRLNFVEIFEIVKNLKISTRKIEFRKSWKIMCAVAKCKNKKFSLFSTFAVAFSCSLENFI